MKLHLKGLAASYDVVKGPVRKPRKELWMASRSWSGIKVGISWDWPIIGKQRAQSYKCKELDSAKPKWAQKEITSSSEPSDKDPACWHPDFCLVRLRERTLPGLWTWIGITEFVIGYLTGVETCGHRDVFSCGNISRELGAVIGIQRQGEGHLFWMVQT